MLLIPISNALLYLCLKIQIVNIVVNSSANGIASNNPLTLNKQLKIYILTIIKQNVLENDINALVNPSDKAVKKDDEKILTPQIKNPTPKNRKPILIKRQVV